jgi:amidase
VDGIAAYLNAHGSTRIHPLLTGFLDRLRPFRVTVPQFAARWAQWDEYRSALARFFQQFDAILCPVYTQPALAHGDSLKGTNFEGFSYTMAWNVAGAPAATVRCAESEGLPVNLQIVTKPWHDVLALDICQLIEQEFGGWQPPVIPLRKSLQSQP